MDENVGTTTPFQTVSLEQQPGYDRLVSSQQTSARLTLSSLEASSKEHFLDPTRIRRIADFGAGIGGPTVGLLAAAKPLGATVDAIEQTKPFANYMNNLGILPPEQIIAEDGIVYLNSLDQRGIPKYDLVTAFRFGPDAEGSMFRALVHACGDALNPDGNLLVTADALKFDPFTLPAVIKVLNESNAEFHHIAEVHNGEETTVPDVLIIPQKSCTQISPAAPPG